MSIILSQRLIFVQMVGIKVIATASCIPAHIMCIHSFLDSIYGLNPNRP